jgi:membrane protein DedA with SNARE-associated domain
MTQHPPRPRRPAEAVLAAILIALLLLPGTTVAQPALEADAEAFADAASRDLEAAVARVQPLVERYGYAGVVGAVSVEGFGVPAPGQTLLMAGALEAARGHMHPLLLFPLAVLAAVLGNSLGYVIGKRGGRPLLRRLHVNEAREAKLAGLFERFGGGFIVLARFLDGPRQLNGILAGTLAMPWWLFTVFNVLGAMLWVGIWGLGTFYLSEHLHAVHALIQRINPWIAAAAALALIAVVAYLFRGRRRDGEAPMRPSGQD